MQLKPGIAEQGQGDVSRKGEGGSQLDGGIII